MECSPTTSKDAVKPNWRWQYENPWGDERMGGGAGKLVDILAVSLLYMTAGSRKHPIHGVLVQLVRILPCHGSGQGFESPTRRHLGVIMLTDDAREEFRKAFEKARIANEKSANDFWDSLTYEQKCDAFHAVVSRICEGEIKVKGSYRYVLYDIFGFEPDMYTRGMDCGYMALHNSIMDDAEFCKANTWMCEDGNVSKNS